MKKAKALRGKKLDQLRDGKLMKKKLELTDWKELVRLTKKQLLRK